MNIKKLGKYYFEKNYIYEQHQHTEYEINYIDSGRCIMVVGENGVALRKGDCLVITPMVSHNFIVSGAQSCRITQIEFSFPSGKQLLDNECYRKFTNCLDVLECLTNLSKYKKNAACSKFYDELFHIEFEKLLIVLNMHEEAAKKPEQVYTVIPLKKALQYIDQHYDENINLENLAQAFNISSRYLRKIFMKCTGLTALEYITARRLEKAKDLLKNSKHSVSEISLDVGYNSCQYFCKIFKHKIGVTPKEFRKQYVI